MHFLKLKHFSCLGIVWVCVCVWGGAVTISGISPISRHLSIVELGTNISAKYYAEKCQNFLKIMGYYIGPYRDPDINRVMFN